MQQHWKIIVWLLFGVIVGLCFQFFLAGDGWIGARFGEDSRGTIVEAIDRSLLPKGRGNSEALTVGDVITSVTLNQGMGERERSQQTPGPDELNSFLAEIGPGGIATLTLAGGGTRTSQVVLDPASPRSTWLAPFRFVADIFMRLLKMLIVPLVLTSIITGVAGLGGEKDFGRLGRKTFGYYLFTSFCAAGLGLFLVNLIRPGIGAELGLPEAKFGERTENWIDILRRMVPDNVFSAFSENGNMLQIIFFALIFGFFITRVPEKPKTMLTDLFKSAFEVVMQIATWVMTLVPYGVFCLIVKVIGETGFDVFRPLGLYMFTVFLALVIHAGVVLALVLYFVAGVSPLRWIKAMSPALLTAFSTSSSSMTLPTTLNTLERRGKVSNKVTSFVAPLGATVNMDGTALYECIGVIFLAQYYATAHGYVLDFSAQVTVVVSALLASIGAAGIPSAGLVMMLTILSALKLPLEGAALLLAVDRPLDMCRTVVNVWSDTVGSAVVSSSEGEKPLQGAEIPANPGSG